MKCTELSKYIWSVKNRGMTPTPIVKWRIRILKLELTEGVKNVSWPWLYPLRGWDSLAVTFLCKFGYI